MPGYFKLKRLGATKTESLPSGDTKTLAQTCKTLEESALLITNILRSIKIALKESSVLEEKHEKEGNEEKISGEEGQNHSKYNHGGN